MATGKKKEDVIKWITIGGIISFIPFVMLAGPLLGYVVGDFIVKRFGLPNYASIICIMIGFLASVQEMIMLIRKAMRRERDQ